MIGYIMFELVTYVFKFKSQTHVKINEKNLICTKL